MARAAPVVSDPLLPGRIRRGLGRCRFAVAVHHRGRVGSTNDVARRLAREGAGDGTLVVAEEQTAGRGRRQRPWISPRGRGIYMSLVLRPPVATAEAGAAVQLLAGIALAEGLAPFLPVPPTLRWPNDCYGGGRKLAGVLVETEGSGAELDFLVCGIGVNVNHTLEDFPEGLRDRAGSLRLLTGHPLLRLPVLVQIIRSLETWYGAWLRHGSSPIRSRWLELSPESHGEAVEVLTDSGTVRGVTAGLSPRGGLLLEVGDGLREITLGEVIRLLPTAAAPVTVLSSRPGVEP